MEDGGGHGRNPGSKGRRRGQVGVASEEASGRVISSDRRGQGRGRGSVKKRGRKGKVQSSLGFGEIKQDSSSMEDQL